MEKKLANPAPLGLMAFAMTTILLNLHNLGLYPLNAMIVSMGIFYGGLAQVIVGIMEFKKGNSFGTTAFTSYGLFWISLVAVWLFPEAGFAAAGTTDSLALGWYLATWGIFSLFMWYGTWGGSKVSQFVFLTVTLLFFSLALHNWTGSAFLGRVAGAIGVICGSSAFYLSMAELMEEVKGKRVLPY